MRKDCDTTGVRRKVKSNAITPSNWSAFLGYSENEVELYSYLSRYLAKKLNVATIHEEVITNSEIDDSSSMPYAIAEADVSFYIPKSLQLTFLGYLSKQ